MCYHHTLYVHRRNQSYRSNVSYFLFSEKNFVEKGVFRYVPRNPLLSSETFHYKKGANQQFCQPTHVCNPASFSEDELQYDMDREMIPIAIHCVTEEGPEGMQNLHCNVCFKIVPISRC